MSEFLTEVEKFLEQIDDEEERSKFLDIAKEIEDMVDSEEDE